MPGESCSPNVPHDTNQKSYRAPGAWPMTHLNGATPSAPIPVPSSSPAHHGRAESRLNVSPLVVLGLLGTLISTITIIPHVIHAVRTKQPSGSPVAWALGAAGSSIWAVYGVVSGDLLVGAPGLITIPCGLMLATWSLRHRKNHAPADPAGTPGPGSGTAMWPIGQPMRAVTDTGTIRVVRLIDEPTVLDPFRSGDTLEMPALTA